MASGGEFDERVQQGLIERLQKRSVVELEQVRQFHEWLDDKRVSRQSGRVVGVLTRHNWNACHSWLVFHPITCERCYRRPTFICKLAYVQPVMGKCPSTE